MQFPFKKYKILGTCMLYLQSIAEIRFFIKYFTQSSFYNWIKNAVKLHYLGTLNGAFEKLLGNTLIFVRLHYKVKMLSKEDSKRVGLKDAH